MLLGSPRAGGTRRSSLSTKILVASGTLLVLVAGIFAGLVGSALLIVLFAGFLVRAVVAPVRRASGAAERLAGGDIATRVPGEGTGETAQLGRAFNAMAASLEEAQADLIRKNADLERALEVADGGSIGVESGKGRGSVFRARLPLQVAAGSAAAQLAFTAKEG